MNHVQCHLYTYAFGPGKSVSVLLLLYQVTTGEFCLFGYYFKLLSFYFAFHMVPRRQSIIAASASDELISR